MFIDEARAEAGAGSLGGVTVNVARHLFTFALESQQLVGCKKCKYFVVQVNPCLRFKKMHKNHCTASQEGLLLL